MAYAKYIRRYCTCTVIMLNILRYYCSIDCLLIVIELHLVVFDLLGGWNRMGQSRLDIYRCIQCWWSFWKNRKCSFCCFIWKCNSIKGVNEQCRNPTNTFNIYDSPDGCQCWIFIIEWIHLIGLTILYTVRSIHVVLAVPLNASPKMRAMQTKTDILWNRRDSFVDVFSSNLKVLSNGFSG